MPKDIVKYMISRHLEKRLGENIEKLELLSKRIFEYHVKPVTDLIDSDDFQLTEDWDDVFADFKSNIRNYIPDFIGSGKFGINFPLKLEEAVKEIPFLRNDEDIAELLNIPQGVSEEDVSITETPVEFLSAVGPNIYNSVIQSITEDYNYPEMKISLSMAGAYHDVYSSGIPEALVDVIKVAKTLLTDFKDYVDMTKIYMIVLPIPGALADRHFSISGLLSVASDNDPELIDFDFSDIQVVWPYLNMVDFLDLRGQFGRFVTTSVEDSEAENLGIDMSSFLSTFRDDFGQVRTSLTSYVNMISPTPDLASFMTGFFNSGNVDDIFSSLRNVTGNFNFMNTFNVRTEDMIPAIQISDTIGSLNSILSGQDVSSLIGNSLGTFTEINTIVQSTNNSELTDLFRGTLNEIFNAGNSDLILNNASDIFNTTFTSVDQMFNSGSLTGIVNNFDTLLQGSFDVDTFTGILDTSLTGMLDGTLSIDSLTGSVDNILGGITGSVSNIFTGLNPSNLMSGLTNSLSSITLDGVLNFGGNMLFDSAGLTDLLGGSFDSFFTDFSVDGIIGGVTGGLMNISLGSVFDGLPSFMGGMSFGGVLGGFGSLFNGVPFMQAFNVGNIMGGIPVIGPALTNIMGGMPIGQALMGGLSQSLGGMLGGLGGLAGLICSVGGVGNKGGAGAGPSGAQSPSQMAGGIGTRAENSAIDNEPINENIEAFSETSDGWDFESFREFELNQVQSLNTLEDLNASDAPSFWKSPADNNFQISPISQSPYFNDYL